MVEKVVLDALRQTEADVRFEWGPAGAEHLADDGGAVVVVDALSFTTAVSVATGRGIAVYPFPLAGEGAEAFAAERGAALAVPRSRVSDERPWSLSPRSLLDAPLVARLVLPSPNGSAVAALFTGADATVRDVVVLAACLRNASATAAWLTARGYGAPGKPVALVAAGERWPDGSLRPALEDLLGAGAVAARLGGRLSVEAGMAASAFAEVAVGGRLAETIERCASGRELDEMGFPTEAGLAAELDADGHAAVLTGGAFVGA